MIVKSNAEGKDTKRNGTKTRAAVSTNCERTLKSARTGALSDTRRLENISTPRQQNTEDGKVEDVHLVNARNVRDCAALSLVREISNAVAYVRQGRKLLHASGLAALPGHRLAGNIVNAGRSRATVRGD